LPTSDGCVRIGDAPETSIKNLSKWQVQLAARDEHELRGNAWV